MKLIPNSLLGRNVLLLVALILIGQLLAGLVFRQFVQTPFVQRMAKTLAEDLIAVGEGLKRLAPGQRENFVNAFNARDAARPRERDDAPITLPAERMLIRETSSLLAKEGYHTVWRRERGGSFFIQLPIDGQTYWLATTGLQPTMHLPRAALASWLVGIILALLGAWLIQRRINRPLTQLAHASQSIGRGDATAPLPEDGPHEIAAVCHSFNQMQQRLAEQDQQRALMLAGVSHDLRTPLTKIRLTVEILSDQTGSDHATSIARYCNQIENIIGQFTDFAGIDNGENPVRTDINRLIDELVRELDAPFTLTLGELPMLTMRPRALRRLLTNLIENALHHAQPPYAITTCLEAGLVIIRVQDRGPGIPPERADDMLKPFTRGNEARNGPPGSGLGLAIAARIVQMEHGRLSLHPVEDGGLEVRIELPSKQMQKAAVT